MAIFFLQENSHKNFPFTVNMTKKIGRKSVMPCIVIVAMTTHRGLVTQPLASCQYSVLQAHVGSGPTQCQISHSELDYYENERVINTPGHSPVCIHAWVRAHVLQTCSLHTHVCVCMSIRARAHTPPSMPKSISANPVKTRQDYQSCTIINLMKPLVQTSAMYTTYHCH